MIIIISMMIKTMKNLDGDLTAAFILIYFLLFCYVPFIAIPRSLAKRPHSLMLASLHVVVHTSTCCNGHHTPSRIQWTCTTPSLCSATLGQHTNASFPPLKPHHQH
jgi:hypothetical protein